ncbi:MAG TPA: hypothetical protein DHV36_23725 [Desulfobacteraceae bacterium]|nr:hypothetical protein [Desulfobacteraceae bacterium]|tara:strand:- start:2728 stop:3390 length:663 start_codon:yes stop_codon:yes gene_type:complete
MGPLVKTAIIPAYNEEKTIADVVAVNRKLFTHIIVVDDCSADNTVEVAKNAGAIVIESPKNRGYDAAINKGFFEAGKLKSDVYVTFDADGQHQYKDIKRGLDMFTREGLDLLIAMRPAHKKHFSEKIFAFYTALKYRIDDPLCGLKFYSGKAYGRFKPFSTYESIGTELALRISKSGEFKTGAYEIDIRDRTDVSRFYEFSWKGNYRILKSLVKAVAAGL